MLEKKHVYITRGEIGTRKAGIYLAAKSTEALDTTVDTLFFNGEGIYVSCLLSSTCWRQIGII